MDKAYIAPLMGCTTAIQLRQHKGRSPFMRSLGDILGFAYSRVVLLAAEMRGYVVDKQPVE
ncbi:hypothetical protein JOH51_005948 [Rhizobium leguminosarum]|nr:hypothetical protein [Rhizobium leguminosarum]